MKKLKTIDEVCNQPKGTFLKFIEEQHAEWRRDEESRKQRIRDATKKKEIVKLKDALRAIKKHPDCLLSIRHIINEALK